MTVTLRTVVAVGAAAAALLGGAAGAQAQPPPNCTAADLSGVSAGVRAATSAYLFTHPDVNAFFTGLKGLPAEEVRTKVADYAAANPQVKADLVGIRQPLVDFRNRCDAPAPEPALAPEPAPR
ncbi:heme-binding protein [Mycolicibacterium litorale]|uniref:heme-binding protein n=1 Tax=Mycolicibacterium litorale TaxID=758802 RepID=UPI003CF6FF21